MAKTNASGGSTPDATDVKKGKLKLTNDLGGTADSPTTPNDLKKASNLSDLTSASTARTNLGLGTAALVADSTLIHTTGNETLGGTKTFSSPIVVPNGSASAPSVGFSSNTNLGIYRLSSNVMGVAGSGTEVMRFSSGSNISQVPFQANTGFWLASQNIGTTLNLSRSTTKGMLMVNNADCTINLPQIAWTFLPSVYYIYDPLGLLSTGFTGLTIHPYDDGVSVFNDINGADPVNGAWNDPGFITTAPYGNDAVLNDQFATYMLVINPSDTGSGAIGGWTIYKISGDLNY